MAPRDLPADVIADIYEAALDDERWPSIAEIVVAQAVGISSGSIWIVEDGQIVDFAITEDAKEAQGPYLAHYSKFDVWNQGLLRGPWEKARLGYENFSERELLKTEFYNDFARHYGMFRPMGAVTRLARGAFATVATIERGTKRLLDETDKPRLERVVPHVRRALQLRLRQRERLPRERMHTAALDALAFGVLVCSADGRILLANKAAAALAAAGAGITLGDRRKGLGALVQSEAKALGALVRDAASGRSGGVMRLTGRGGGTELVALVTPLPRNFGLPGGGAPQAYALVTLRSAHDSPSFSAEILSVLFGLSPTQAAVALAIFNGKDPEQIAAERGVAISTLRTHLAEIFLRTGAESQRDLVRLLGMLPPVRAQSGTDEL